MEVTGLTAKCDSGRAVLAAHLFPTQWSGKALRLYFSADGAQYTPQCRGDPIAAALLVPCMLGGEDLHIVAPVSDELLTNIERIQSLLAHWYPKQLRKIHVTAQSESPSSVVPAQGTGCFFSGGVDSWYSYLTNVSQITHLVFVHGFNSKPSLEDEEGLTALREQLIAAAEMYGKQALVVRTNIRQLSDAKWRGAPWVDKRGFGQFWAGAWHGSILAAVGLFLNPLLGRVFIASSAGDWPKYSRSEPLPWGSHPELDHLWSTSSVQFVHDSAQRTRLEKIHALAANDLALSYLRVCSDRSCGECEKCLRTMAALRIAGGLERATAFGPGRTEQLIPRLRRLSDSPSALSIRKTWWYEELRARAEEQRDSELAEALALILSRRFSLMQKGRFWLGRVARRLWAIMPNMIRNGLKQCLAKFSAQV